MKLETAIASPLTPTPLPRGERGYSHAPSNSVPSPLEGEGQGEGYVDAALSAARTYSAAALVAGWRTSLR
jgi:hypothetical protein